ncbi:EAL domain-containing protein [Burkholderia sola]|uniref:EAL domain-containing protein n=1 Tax=Burkholderia sola TaxID=2843302 RepID=UPI0023DDE4F1|nr:EAL domain-containing protein [Burkholderia sola]MDF3083703.1 EAL domain-containing protein [Burkholderia sola]
MVLAAIAQDRVVLHAQPIRSVNDDEEPLYYECLVRILGDDNQVTYPSAFICSLERLELIRFLDRYVVGMAIEFMESDIGLHLGVNISAQSANEIQWWESIIQRLAGRPDIARRLVVEITETTQLSRVSGHVLVERLQQVGCRIAVDDLGDGFSIENSARIVSPDIIKISGRMLPKGGSDEVRFDQFEELVTRARRDTPQVVVEGIESAESLRIAALSGANWVQGYYVGRPHRLGKTKNSNGGSVDRSVMQFKRIADALLDPHVDERTRSEVELAYAAGLTSALYGRHSAIAAGLRSSLIKVMRTMKGRPVASAQLLRCFAMLGRLNGEGLAGSIGSGISS